VELGLDAPEALEALQRCLAVIAQIEERASKLPTHAAELGQPGSNIAELVSVLPDPPVYPIDHARRGHEQPGMPESDQ